VRIISGTARGTKLRSLPDPVLRPMLDRVKESLFAILRNLLDDACVLDLFAGSGSLGLEALSRGARGCLFVEQDGALSDLIVRNVQRCGFADRCQTVRSDVLALGPPPLDAPGVPADLVFVDPPYALADDSDGRARLLGALEGMVGAWVRPGAVAVLHHRPMPRVTWPSARFGVWDRRVYGRSELTFFEVSEEAADE